MTPQIDEKHIMVIDDSMTVRHIIEGILLREGYSVSVFPDGLTAMRALKYGEAPIPHLLLLDIGLPQMDGYTIARLFQQKDDLKHTKIVLITGLNTMLDRAHGRLVGAKDYITKPFKPGDIVRVARKYAGPPHV